MTDPLSRALAEITPVLEALGIRYIVIGSLASSTRGIYRATQDGDLLAVLAPGQGARLAASLGPRFYAEPEMIDRAIRVLRRHRQSSLQLSWRAAGEGGSVQLGPLTHQLLSEYIGTTRQIVTQHMNQFRRDSLLDYSRAGIVLTPLFFNAAEHGYDNGPARSMRTPGEYQARSCEAPAGNTRAILVA